MRYLTLIPILFALFSFAPLAAQDASSPDVGWSVEQSCIGEPTSPPEGWTYDGTILYQGEYGIHGLRADWSTSRVLAFTNPTSPGNSLFDGALSPDKHWYAAAEGTVRCSGHCTNSDFEVINIQVFDIGGTNPRKSYSIPWNLDYSDYPGGGGHPRISWLSNEEFIYPFRAKHASGIEVRTANPFTGEITSRSGYLDLFVPNLNAPDFSRTLKYIFEGENRYEHLIDSKTGELVALLGDKSTLFLPDWAEVWSPDSEQFLLAHYLAPRTIAIHMVDRSGSYIETLMTLPSADLQDRYFFEVKWSPNNRFIALFSGANRSQDSGSPTAFTTYIIDLQQKRITDTCMANFKNFQWSPDSTQLVDGTSLFDLVDWKRHHLDIDGLVIGWRAD